MIAKRVSAPGRNATEQVRRQDVLGGWFHQLGWNAIPPPNDADDPGRQIAVYHDGTVPEPTSLALGALALAGLGCAQRKRVLR